MSELETVEVFRAGLESTDKSLLDLLRDGYEGRMADLEEARDRLSIPIAYVEADEAHQALADAIYGITRVIAAHQTLVDEINHVLGRGSVSGFTFVH